ncbi:DNA glycosylase [Crucibulum laeve]|uniref:DNA-(apurinic or apyrimidinic site) lyase n=1 Tax=Crucibulum laeve TaxID=68775 RepID=A0A5C3MDB5_9AGAR|nr:DNA glycosylase [Crucibulum laeve]
MVGMIPTGFKALPLPILQLSLAAVLRCGQSFRWSIFQLQESESQASLPPQAGAPTVQPTHEYRLCLRDRVVCLRQSSDTLFYRSVYPDPQPTITQLPLREAETLAWLNDYFQLDVNLLKLYEQWAARDKVFAKFQDRFGGIRMLRQDPWENLISFICSSNNNISRITKMVQGLCKQYSSPLLSLPNPNSPTEETLYYPFPAPSVLAQPDVGTMLRTLGFGYRAEFIQRTAKMLVDEHGTATKLDDPSEESERWLMALRNKSTTEAREELLKFIGVRRKVADCILLMSLDKNEVIPVDTHVHQIAMKHYGMKGASGGKSNMTPKLYDELSSKLVGIWGDYAGWAHTVLFTADLKSFSNYGLSTPGTPPSLPGTPSPKKRSRASQVTSQDDVTPITPIAPSTVKRKISILAEEVSGLSLPPDTLPEAVSLADRVKRRRRITRTDSSPLP